MAAITVLLSLFPAMPSSRRRPLESAEQQTYPHRMADALPPQTPSILLGNAKRCDRRGGRCSCCCSVTPRSESTKLNWAIYYPEAPPSQQSWNRSAGEPKGEHQILCLTRRRISSTFNSAFMSSRSFQSVNLDLSSSTFLTSG